MTAQTRIQFNFKPIIDPVVAPNNPKLPKPPLIPQQQQACHNLTLYSKQLVVVGGGTALAGGFIAFAAPR